MGFQYKFFTKNFALVDDDFFKNAKHFVEKWRSKCFILNMHFVWLPKLISSKTQSPGFGQLKLLLVLH